MERMRDPGLTKHQLAICDQELAREDAQRRHLVVALSGAHAYGFPSPDSDLDLKAIHIAPTAQLVGLNPGKQVANRLEIIEGVEIDYTSNELGRVLAGILNGDGNFTERVLGPLPMRSSAEHDALAPLVAAGLSKRLHRHYAGFASSQLRHLEAAEKPTAKKALYVLRTALTGAHVLRSGRLVTDLTELMEDAGFGDAAELVERKTRGERVQLGEEEREHWMGRCRESLDYLETARERSILPDEAPNRGEVEAFLIEMRRRYFDP